jgi:hypothetical protein
MHSVVNSAVRKIKGMLKLEACHTLVVGEPQVDGQQQRDKAQAHSHAFDGPLILARNEQDEEHRQ